MENESDQVRCGPMGEDDWKDQRIASLEAYIAQLKDQQAMAEPTQETGKAAEVAHPWYGPCDALAADGACAECIKVAAAEPTRATDANRAEALHGADLGRWCSEHPNLAAITIEALRGQMAEPTREEMIEAIRKYCRSISSAAIQRSQGEDRIYYAGLPIGGLADAILALKPSGGQTREGGK